MVWQFVTDGFVSVMVISCNIGCRGVAEIENLLNNSIIGTVSDKALLLDYKAAMADQTSKAIKLEQQALELITEINADNALLVSNLNANMGALYHKTNKNEYDL